MLLCRALVFSILGFVVTRFGSAAVVGIRTLPPVSVDAAAELIEPEVASFLVGKDRIIVFPSRRDYFISVPYHSDKVKKEERFETKLSQKRIRSDKINLDASHSFPISFSRGYLFFDGGASELMQLSRTFEPISPPRELMYDLIKPASDRGGEPTWFETQNLQGRFKREYLAHKGEKFSGISPIPFEWASAQLSRGRARSSSSSKQNVYLVVSRIKGFLVDLMSCSEKDPSECVLERSCSVHNLPSTFRAKGITVVKDTELVLIGDEHSNRIGVFTFHKSLDLVYKEAINIPSQVKQFSDLQVDDAGRLWISSLQPDNYFNASLFMWEAKDW